MAHRAVFLDRDGVLNALVLNPANGEYESPHAPKDLQMMPGIGAALRRLQAAGYLMFIVSNQPSYTKGKTTLEKIQSIAAAVEESLRAEGVTIARAFYCYHHPQGTVGEYVGECRCRKPKPQMLLDARDQFDLDLSECWMIGDQESDIECGRRAGCRTILIANPHSQHRRPGVEHATLDARDLSEAVEKLLAHAGVNR